MENVIAYFTMQAGTDRADQYAWFCAATMNDLSVHDIVDTLVAGHGMDRGITEALVRSYLDIIEEAE